MSQGDCQELNVIGESLWLRCVNVMIEYNTESTEVKSEGGSI